MLKMVTLVKGIWTANELLLIGGFTMFIRRTGALGQADHIRGMARLFGIVVSADGGSLVGLAFKVSLCKEQKGQDLRFG